MNFRNFEITVNDIGDDHDLMICIQDYEYIAELHSHTDGHQWIFKYDNVIIGRSDDYADGLKICFDHYRNNYEEVSRDEFIKAMGHVPFDEFEYYQQPEVITAREEPREVSYDAYKDGRKLVASEVPLNMIIANFHCGCDMEEGAVEGYIKDQGWVSDDRFLYIPHYANLPNEDEAKHMGLEL